MYLIDKNKKTMTKVSEMTFRELDLQERQDFQEWICNDPSVLCTDKDEELMIIQKEFSQWDETKERLDLLAIDKRGNLVIIENKLDDSGSNVTWQALKYASYCASLSKDDIVEIFQDYLNKQHNNRLEISDVEAKLDEFLDGNMEHINEGYQQRIILVAAKFRSEVTSTVLWLQQGYGLQIKCFKATPYKHNGEIFLTFEQILPLKNAENYTINMAKKTQDNIASQEKAHKLGALRQKFWSQLQEAIRNNPDTDQFTNITPPKDNWIAKASGINGINFVVVISAKEVRVEIEILTGDKAENKRIFDKLHEHKGQIKANYEGEPITWDRMDNFKSSRIRIIKELDGNDEENWPDATEFIIKHLEQIDKVIRPEIERILKSNL